MIDYSIIASIALTLSILNLGLRFWDRRKQSSPVVDPRGPQGVPGPQGKPGPAGPPAPPATIPPAALVSDSTTPVASVPVLPGSVVVCSQCGRRVVRASGGVCANCLK